MRVLHYLDRVSLAHGGVTRAVLDTCRAIADAGCTVTLLTKQATDVPPDWTDNPTVVEVPARIGGLGLFNRVQRARLRRLVAEADAVHLHTPWETANLQLRALCRELSKPYVVSLHGMLDDWSMAQKALKKKLTLRLLARRLLRDAHTVLCTADAEKTQSARWLPRDNAAVIPLIFDTEPYRGRPDPALARDELLGATDDPVILFLSRIHPKKGVEHLLAAAAELALAHPFRLIVAGPGEPGYVAELGSLAERLGIADRTRFPGQVDGELKRSLYAAADVFVLPTSQENFGLVLPEALACGTPVITTRGVDIWPELEASGGAIITDQSPDSLAAAIGSILTDSARRDAMGAAGRNWALTYLDPTAVTRRYLDLYARSVQSVGRVTSEEHDAP